ncbi:hypothetical protein RhiirA5_476182 [Rhizophagus irregularis]|uniref:Uncharacterized protein n=1 Tax=Rhizophagus irregularis TaxID=588596 RepID=A0A2N0PPU8_9GLOM|nr:hypothetical protein RhiirA5_476182 [Rhizophagus irregularis]
MGGIGIWDWDGILANGRGFWQKGWDMGWDGIGDSPIPFNMGGKYKPSCRYNFQPRKAIIKPNIINAIINGMSYDKNFGIRSSGVKQLTMLGVLPPKTINDILVSLLRWCFKNYVINFIIVLN